MESITCYAHGREDEEVEGEDEREGEERPGSKDDDEGELSEDRESLGGKVEDGVGDEVVNVGKVLHESVEDHPDRRLVEEFLR